MINDQSAHHTRGIPMNRGGREAAAFTRGDIEIGLVQQGVSSGLPAIPACQLRFAIRCNFRIQAAEQLIRGPALSHLQLRR